MTVYILRVLPVEVVSRCPHVSDSFSRGVRPTVADILSPDALSWPIATASIEVDLVTGIVGVARALLRSPERGVLADHLVIRGVVSGIVIVE